MKTIILYGELAKRFGKNHRFAVKSAAEAIRALRANFKGFEKYMATAHLHGMGFKIFVGGHSLDYSEVPSPVGQKNEVIRIVPAVMGSGGSPWLRILVGAVLIVAGFYTSGFGGQFLISLGAGLALGGVAQLLTKTPKLQTGTTDENKNKASYVFNGPQNVTAQGNPVPIIYGRVITGSAVISAGIDVHEE